MTAEGVEISAETEEARAKRRAIATLLQIAQRMALLAMEPSDGSKLKGELGGMSAWIEAFTCQLAGIPIMASALPKGELRLVSLEFTTHGERDVDCRATLGGESLGAEVTTAASEDAAMALALASLAHLMASRASGRLPRDSETLGRHRDAERLLGERLGDATRLYELDLDPDRDVTQVAEMSCHGLPEDG